MYLHRCITEILHSFDSNVHALRSETPCWVLFCCVCMLNVSLCPLIFFYSPVWCVLTHVPGPLTDGAEHKHHTPAVQDAITMGSLPGERDQTIHNSPLKLRKREPEKPLMHIPVSHASQIKLTCSLLDVCNASCVLIHG